MKEILNAVKKNIVPALGILIVILGAVVLICLFTPAKRYSRAVLKAEKAYTAGNYEKSSEMYEKALGIYDDRPESYLGLLEAKEAGASEDLKEVFNEGLEAFSEKLSEDERYVNQNTIIEYVLHESIVFADDTDSRLSALFKGYELTDGAEDIKRILTEVAGDKILTLETCENYDEAIETAESYREYTDIDADTIIGRLEEEKAFKETKDTLLEKIYAAMSEIYAKLESGDEESPFDFDYTAICEIDGSDDADSVAGSFISDSYTLIIDGDNDTKTGTGAGLYTFGERYRTEKGGVAIPYYFYVGGYKNGLRSGFGVAFTRTSERSYILYAGEWENDEPSGEGTKYVHNESVDEEENVSLQNYSYYGNWKEGLSEGEISVTVTSSEWEDVVFTGTLTAEDGICSEVPTETEDYVVLNIRDGRLIGILTSDTEGYALMITLWQNDGEMLEAIK